MNNKYLQELYGWISTTDRTFDEKYTLDEFVENMDSEDYAIQMYSWISEQDPTFQDRYTVDLFVEKVKKKDLSPQDAITESMEDASLLDGSQEMGSQQIAGPTVNQDSSEGVIPIKKEFKINEGEVDEETYNEYTDAQDQRQQIADDPFENALSYVNAELVSQNEKNLSVDLKYRFGRYGFEFTPDIIGDNITITSKQIDPNTGKPYTLEIEADSNDEELNLKTAKNIQDFIRKYQKVDTRFEDVSGKILNQDKKFQSEGEIKNAFKILDGESKAFNSKVQEYIRKRRIYLNKKAQADGLTQAQINTDIGQAFLKELEQARVSLETEKEELYAEDVNLSNRGYEIDLLVGKYSEMNAGKGTFMGAMWDGFTTGVSRLSETPINYLIDGAVEVAPFSFLVGSANYEKSFAKRAEELGYFDPSDLDQPYASFQAFKESFSSDQISEIDNYIEDRAKKKLKYGNISFNEDGSITTDRARLGSRYSEEMFKSDVKELTSDGMLPLVRKGYDMMMGDDDTTPEYSDLMRQGFWGGAMLGLSESIPAFLPLPGGWISRTGRMFAQVDSHLTDEMMNNPNFADIPESERKAVAMPIAIVVGALEYVGFRNIMNQKGLLNKYVLKGLQLYKGSHQTKGLTFRQIVLNEIQSDISKGVLIVGAAGLAEFETGVAQEIADISGKSIYNEIKGTEMFQTPDGFKNALGQIIYAGGQEMVGGWVMGTIPGVAAGYVGNDYTAISDPMFETFESISSDRTYFTAFVQKIKNDINSGTIDKKEGQSLLNAVNALNGIVDKVPQDIDVKLRKKAVGLLYNKSLLLQKRDKLAPELRGKVDKEIGKIDKELKNLIDGAVSVKGTEANIEQEEEVSDEQATAYINNENETRSKLGLPAIKITPESIKNAKLELKKEKDASKEQSPVQETGEVESQSTEEVDETVSSGVQESAGTSNQKGTEQGKTTAPKKTEIEEEVSDITEFVGETETDGVVNPTTELGVQEEVEFETENVTKDGKVKRSKATKPVDTKVKGKFNSVIKFASRAASAVKRILPKVNIILHESSENFKQATGKTGKGFFNPTNQTIHIDLTKGSNKTVAHEMFHALLVNSVKTNPQARELTKRMVKAVAKAKGLTKEQKQKIDTFISNYDADIQNEEKLAEILGVLADGYTKLDAPTKSKIRQWVEKIAAKLGLDLTTFTKSDQDIIDLMNTVAQKIRSGETITKKDVAALKTKTKPKPKKQTPKKKKGDQLDVFEGREQKEAKPIAERYMMSLRGFISPRSLYDTSRLKRELENIGMRLGTAKNEFTGEITGYYFQKVSKRGNPYFYNPFGRQQKDIDKAGSGISNIAELVVKLKENNFTPEAIKKYLIEKKNIASNIVNKLVNTSSFVLSRMPESFQKLKGGFLTGIKLFNKIAKYKDRLSNNNTTPFGKKMVELKQELEQLKAQKNKKRDIAKTQLEIDNLKAKNPGAKIYKLTNTEIMSKTIEFLRKQPEYMAVKDKKGLSLIQAQMEMQLEKAFYQAPTKDMANQMRLARAIVNIQTKNVQSLERVKASLRNFIRVVFPADMYTKPETLELVQEVQNATLENIKQVKAKLMDMATTKIVKGLETKIKSLLNKNFTTIEGGRAKARIVDSQTIKLLEQVKSIFNTVQSIKDNPKSIENLVQKNLDKIAKLKTKAVQDENTFAELTALEMINEYANAQLEDDSSFEKVAGLNRVFETLNETVTEGRNTLEAQKRRRYHTYLKDIEIAWESITGNKIELLIQNPNFDSQLPEDKSNLRMIVNPDAKKLMKEYQNLTDAKKRQAKSLPARMINSVTGWIRRNQISNILDLTTLVEYITKIPGELFKGPFQDITARLVDDASIIHKGFGIQDRFTIESQLDKIYGKGWMGKMENDAIPRDTGIAADLERYNKAKAMYQRNKTDENKFKMDALQLHLSPYQIAYHLNQYKDPANHASYEAKYGKDYKRVMKEMREYMEANNPEAVALADYMVNEAYPKMYERYNKTYREVYGMDLPWSKNYGGQIFREDAGPKPEINLLSEGKGAFAGMAAPSSSKVRSKNKLPIQDMDLMRSFIAYREQMNWFAAYAPVLNRMEKLFKNPNIAKAIQSQYPDGFYNMIIKQIDTLATKGLSSTTGEQWLNTATNYFVVGRLGVNPTIYLKQLVSFPTYANDIGFYNWTKNAILSIGEIRSLMKEVLDNSIYLQDRYGKSIIKNLENFVPTTDYEAKLTEGKFDKILNATMYLVKQGDKGAIMIGGIPLYRYHKNKIRKENPGLTDQQVIAKAIREFEIATRQTQQSTDLQNRDYTQTAGIFARTMNMFKTSIRSYLRKEIIYFRNSNKIIRSFGKEGRGTLGQNLRGLLTYHTVLPVFFQYLSAGLPGVLAPWDEEDKTDLTRAVIIGNFNALFVTGDILAMFADAITGKPWEADVTDVPLIEVAELISKQVQRIARTKDEDKKNDLMIKFMMEDVPSYFGLNLKSLNRWRKNIQQVMEDPSDPKEVLLRLFNFSDFQIKSDEERNKKKTKSLSKRDLKRMFPDLYEEMQVPDDVQQQIDEIEAEIKRVEEEAQIQ